MLLYLHPLLASKSTANPFMTFFKRRRGLVFRILWTWQQRAEPLTPHLSGLSVLCGFSSSVCVYPDRNWPPLSRHNTNMCIPRLVSDTHARIPVAFPAIQEEYGWFKRGKNIIWGWTMVNNHLPLPCRFLSVLMTYENVYQAITNLEPPH